MVTEFFIIKKKINKLFNDIFSENDLVLDIGCGNKPYYHKNIKAKIICADRTTGPTDALIHQTLTSIVNKTECNEQDIIDIRTIIKTDPNLCG